MARQPIIVTGAAGFIGSWVVRRLLARGERVVGVDNLDPFYDIALKHRNLEAIMTEAPTSGGPGGPAWDFAQADIVDHVAMDALFARVKPDGVIHLAAKAGVRPSIEDPVGYARANVQGTAVILESARKARCQRIVVASSSSVYGNASKVPFAESDDVSAPISPYAATKRACELMGHAHWSLTNMPTAMLRFFTVYGPCQRPDLAIQSFLGKVSRGELIRMFGDGTTSRDYTYIDDIVTGVLASFDRIDRFGYRIWNLGGNAPVTLREMIDTIGRVVGKPPRIEPQPMQPGDVERTYADLTRSGTELGYAPTTGFEAGVAKQWAWLKQR